MATKRSRLRYLRESAQSLIEDRLWNESSRGPVYKFAHFWVMVGRSFVRNRCPVRASALAYTTLLAMIPMLAVVAGITSTFLKKEGEDKIDQFIVEFVASITPPAMLQTNAVVAATNLTVAVTNVAAAKGAEDPSPEDVGAELASGSRPADTNIVSITRTSVATNLAVVPSFVQAEDAVQVRKQIARTIKEFIQNTRSGTLGVTGSVLLIFVGISMLRRIESTFNDMWGVARGRSWFHQIVLYWGVISLVPLLLVLAVGLASGPHMETTRKLITSTPFVGNLLFRVLPVLLLCLTFSAFYIAIPNTRVHWSAALSGGFAGGILFHLNSLISVLYVSRVVSNSKIYGGLGLVAVFMIGLYFGWVILLFGAQVAYAFQNRVTYLEEKQVEQINQRGREFVALRIMTFLAHLFVRGEPPPSLAQLAAGLCVPTRLVQQVLNTLVAARLVVETSGQEIGYCPARPLEAITCHDVLQAMRASQGNELATRDEPARAEVYGEFRRIMEAEQRVASSVTMLALADRIGRQLPQMAPQALAP